MSPTYARLHDRGVLALAGEDSRPFLQGLVSNDVMRVGPGRAIHAALLTPRESICSTSASARMNAGGCCWMPRPPVSATCSAVSPFTVCGPRSVSTRTARWRST